MTFGWHAFSIRSPFDFQGFKLSARHESKYIFPLLWKSLVDPEKKKKQWMDSVSDSERREASEVPVHYN